MGSACRTAARHRTGFPNSSAIPQAHRRHFFPLKMELFLDLSRFELLSFPPTGSLDAEPGLDTWTANIVARAVIATLEVSGVQLKLGRAAP